MNNILVPPIKCQGIKTKLVPLILANAQLPVGGRWIEPFMGSGVVGLNARPRKALFTDVNPHLIAFYNAIKSNVLSPEIVRRFLEREGVTLQQQGEAHYYSVRDRFNIEGNPLDFLFLSRSCFNGMIRFNRKGAFNVPFCKKPERFSKAYITKIVNQLRAFWELVQRFDWSFVCQDFAETISSATANDFIYCDPPYIGRHVDYFNSWEPADEQRLSRALRASNAKFILSTWHSNKYRVNEYVESIWSELHIVTQEHFYHVGAKEDNRNSMTEALIMNFRPPCIKVEKQERPMQGVLGGITDQP